MIKDNNPLIQLDLDSEKYKVNYRLETIDGLVEIQGVLEVSNDAVMNIKFTSTHFLDDLSESYYDDNWQDIYECIIDKFTINFIKL